VGNQHQRSSGQPARGSVFGAGVRASVLCEGALARGHSAVVLSALVVVAGFGLASAAEPPDKRQASDWPMWRGGTDRRGSAGRQEPIDGNVIWAYPRDDKTPFYASPAVVGNRVYITSADYRVFRDRGAVLCLDADTGRLIWQFAPKGFRATFSSPAVCGKYLVVGEGLHLTADARVFCLDVTASEKAGQGVKLWEYRTKSRVESSPCIDGNRAYIGAGEDGFYCLALEPGRDGQPVVVWHVPSAQYPDCASSPVVHQGKVYFGLGMGGKAVCCLDALTGKELWRIATPCPVYAGPSIAAGKLFVGMGYGSLVETAEHFAANLRTELAGKGKSDEEIEKAVAEVRVPGAVWCIDLATRAVEWKFKTGRAVFGAVAVDGKHLYFGSQDGHLYCLTTRGKLVCKWKAPHPIVTAPAVGQRYAYTITQEGLLAAIGKNDLTLVWKAPLGIDRTGFTGFSSPALARGHVYVGTGNGLLCVGRPGPARVPQTDTRPAEGRRRTGAD